MVDVTSVDDLPPSVMDLLRMFLAATSRGEQVSLVLESRSKTITSKYQCAEKLAGSPASTETPRIMKKKNPAQLRRSKLRQEAFFRKKHEEAEASGNQKSADSMPNKAAGGAQQLLVQLESQQTGNPVDQGAGGIPQVDGSENPTVEETKESEVYFTFISDYGDEDVRDSLRELLEDNLVPSLTTLVSRVRLERLSADHLCTVKLMIPDTKRDFSWPDLPGYPAFFKDVKRL